MLNNILLISNNLTKKPFDSVLLIFRKGKFSDSLSEERVFVRTIFSDKGSKFWAMDEDVAPFLGACTRRANALPVYLPV